MTYRILFFQVLVTLFFGLSPSIMLAGHKQMPLNMQDMEKEMAEANRAIEEYVASLPPAEQAEFNRQVEEMSQMFENMSDEDFEKFLGEMFTEDQMPQPDFLEAPQIIEEEVIEAPQLSVEQLKKVETAITILNDIIKQSNLFMVIVSSSPELPNRINKWGEKGSISDWRDGMKWETLKIDLEYFVQKLYKVQEQNLTTKEYKYLLDLIADEALYNNVIQLRTSLNSLLPIINIPEFGIQKLSDSSKTAIIDILKKYTESLYLLNMPQSLDALFEKYEPQAKKIREAEEAATKRAAEALKEPRNPAEPTEAGTESEMMGYDSYGGYGNYGGYDGGYGGYDNGYSSPYYGGGSDYNHSPESSSGRGSGGSRGAGGGGTRGGDAAGTAQEPSKDDKKDKGKTEEAEEYIPNDKMTEFVGTIRENLKDINDAFANESYKQLIDIVHYIQATNEEEPVNDILASYILPTVIDKKVTTLTENIKKIGDLAKKVNSTTLQQYQDQIKKIFDNKGKEKLAKLSKELVAFEPMTEAEIKADKEAKKTGTIEKEGFQKVDLTTLSPEKRWAYFADETAKDELIANGNELVEKIALPKDLRTIKKDIDTLFKEVKAFGEKKATKPAGKKAEKPVEISAE